MSNDKFVVLITIKQGHYSKNLKENILLINPIMPPTQKKQMSQFIRIDKYRFVSIVEFETHWHSAYFINNIRAYVFIQSNCDIGIMSWDSVDSELMSKIVCAKITANV